MGRGAAWPTERITALAQHVADGDSPNAVHKQHPEWPYASIVKHMKKIRMAQTDRKQGSSKKRSYTDAMVENPKASPADLKKHCGFHNNRVAHSVLRNMGKKCYKQKTNQLLTELQIPYWYIVYL